MSELLRLTGVVFRKELRDHLRDRRSIAFALLWALFGPALLGFIITQQAEDLDELAALKIPVDGGARAPGLLAFLRRAGAEVTEAPADFRAQVKAGQLPAVLVIPPDFPEHFQRAHRAPLELVKEGSRTASLGVSHRIEALLERYGEQVANLRLIARGVSSEVAQPFHLTETDLASSQRRSAAVLGMLPLFLLMAVFIGGLYVAIDAMAGERERQSLEPLLVNPVPPAAVVLGKWLVVLVAAATAAATLFAGFAALLPRLPLEALHLSLRLGPREMGIGALLLAPLGALAAALELLLATYARNNKEAQATATLVLLLPMLPGLVFMMNPGDAALWMRVIPVVAQDRLLAELMRGETPAPVHLALAAAITLALAGALLAATTRLLRRERIVFGR